LRLFEKSSKVVIIKPKMYVSLQFKLQLNSSDIKKLLELMRKQSSAIRSAYKLLLPLLRKFFVRDFSPLKSVMIEGKWQRRTSRLVPLEVGGTSL